MGKSILVVDDDVVNLRLTELVLNREGYETYTVKTGLDAISFLREQKVDLILLDITMPIMNGIKTLEAIRKHPDMATIPVMFLTASADADMVVEACRLEVVDYIIKPFLPPDLLARVGKVLR